MNISVIISGVLSNLANVHNEIEGETLIANVLAELVDSFKDLRKEFPDNKWIMYINQLGVWQKKYLRLEKSELIKALLVLISNSDIQLLLTSNAIIRVDNNLVTFEDSFIAKVRSENFNLPKLRDNYGQDSFIEKPKSNKKDLAKTKVCEIKDSKQLISDICKIENDLIKIKTTLFTNERLEYRYYWEWKLSNEEYQLLKYNLKMLSTVCKDNQKKLRRFIDNHGRLFSLYIAEWYKREYNGNEKNNVFDSIEIPNYAKCIIESLDVASSIQIYKRNANYAYLDSLYIHGGLPIKYLISKQNTLQGDLIRIFKDLYNDEKDEIQIESLGNNYVINESYSSKKSIYCLLMTLYNESLPVHLNDIDQTPFKEFKVLVTEGKKALNRLLYKENRIFDIKWRLDWQEAYHSIYLDVGIIINGVEDRDVTFTAEQIKKIGIDLLPVLNFDIVFRKDEQESILNTISLRKCINETYVLIGNAIVWISLSNILCDSGRIEIVYRSPLNEDTKILRSFDLPDYIQFWKSSAKNYWTDRLKRGEKSGILFLNSNCGLINKTDAMEDFFLFGDSQLRWKLFSELQISILRRGKMEIVENKSDTLEVKLGNITPFKTSIKYDINSQLDYYYNGELIKVFLLRGIPSFTVIINGLILEKNFYKIEYKQNGHKFAEYTDSNLDEGYVRFRITAHNGSTKIINCYFIENKASIRRVLNGDKGHIIFQNINTLIGGCVYEDSYDNKELEYDDEIIFQLGKSNSSLLVPIYRPLLKMDVILNKKVIPYRVLPLSIASKCIFRCFNESGVKRQSVDNIRLTKLEALCFNKLLSKLCLYDINAVINNNEIIIKLDKYEKADNYSFYYINLADRKEMQLDLSRRKGNHCAIRINNINGYGFIIQFWTEKCLNHIKPIEFGCFEELNYFKNRELYLQTAVYAFNMAVKYNLYFSVFDFLNQLIISQHYISAQERLLQFCIKILENNEIDENLLCQLHRFSFELKFDWLLIPVRMWKSYNNNKLMELLKGLIKNRYYANSTELASNIKLANNISRMDFNMQGKKPEEHISTLIEHIRGTRRINEDYFSWLDDEKYIFLRNMIKDTYLITKILKMQ